MFFPPAAMLHSAAAEVDRGLSPLFNHSGSAAALFSGDVNPIK